MSSTLQNKPFLDYSAQLQYLQQKNLQINNPETAIEILSKISYYGLINAYKDVFKNPDTHNFIDGTSIEDIYALYLFDASLREIFLKYILIFEKNIKSSISYHFTFLYGNGIAYYQDINNYECGNRRSDVQNLFSKMDRKINRNSPSPQIAHYMNTYHDVPLWVLTTELTLGETACMYRFLKGHCKTCVCNDFHRIGRAELSKMLIILTKYRNICAHGGRLFNTHTQDSITDCSAHSKLHIPRNNNLYQYGKSDLFSAVICLKYLLSQTDFRDFYYELKHSIKKYNPSQNIMELMGFPENWMSILRIKVYS